MNLKFQTEEKGQRIDKYLCEQTQLTRSRIQQLIEQGAVEVNGKATKSNYKINPVDLIEVSYEDLSELDVVAQDIPLDIRYEDSDVIVINKPRGMVVHPANGNRAGYFGQCTVVSLQRFVRYKRCTASRHRASY